MEHLDSVSETAGTMYLIVAELVPWFTKVLQTIRSQSPTPPPDVRSSINWRF